MKINFTDENIGNEELLIYPITAEELKELDDHDGILADICKIRDLGDFKAKNEDMHCLHPSKEKNVKRILLVGLGDNKKLTLEGIRRAISIAIKKVHSLKITKISISVPEVEKPSNELLQTMIEGVELSNYKFQKYITNDDNKINPITSLKIYNHSSGKPSQVKQVISNSQTICKYTNFARDLVNENSDSKYSLLFTKKVTEVSKKNKLEIVELDETKLKKLNMNLHLAVNSGSKYPPRLLEIHYKGDPKSKKSIALVGKGVTFDTGGLNLKPTKFIEDMKLDMAGAATVAAIINCAAELNIKKNIIAIIPLVENMIGPDAYKPGDVFESYSKKTVEIRNTDAEGRLILADALAYTVDKHKPNLMIDIATLTGACLVALGEFYAGVMTNDQHKLDELMKSSANTAENIWQLPLYDDLAKDLKSEIADLSNSSSKKYGGTIFGGLFLKEFVGETPWIHIDFAGPAFCESAHYYMQKGGTGFGVRMLIDYLKSIDEL